MEVLLVIGRLLATIGAAAARGAVPAGVRRDDRCGRAPGRAPGPREECGAARGAEAGWSRRGRRTEDRPDIYRIVETCF
ncbi:hypothetical protein KTU01_22260 [Kocuria turfanensis]|uniref:Uncharacterized protein n=1 Tax=Kocuria turfanensis TaxID=388357 RepID=A0A512IEH1_9MICC|nr:hypothetical protein KTU01_22260 [Kocuria turfanensis]